MGRRGGGSGMRRSGGGRSSAGFGQRKQAPIPARNANHSQQTVKTQQANSAVSNSNNGQQQQPSALKRMAQDAAAVTAGNVAGHAISRALFGSPYMAAQSNQAGQVEGAAENQPHDIESLANDLQQQHCRALHEDLQACMSGNRNSDVNEHMNSDLGQCSSLLSLFTRRCTNFSQSGRDSGFINAENPVKESWE